MVSLPEIDRRQVTGPLTLVALQPPSIGMAVPVMSRPPGPHSKATSAATPSGATKRPEGWREAMKAFSPAPRARPSFAMKAASRSSIAGVGTVPGQIALQVMSCPAVSSATARVKPISAVLVVT